MPEGTLGKEIILKKKKTVECHTRALGKEIIFKKIKIFAECRLKALGKEIIF